MGKFYGKSYGGGGQQPGSQPDQIDNLIVQNSISFQLAPIMHEIMETGHMTDTREKVHEKAARLAIVSLIRFCARQCDNKKFTPEEVDKFRAMPLDELMSELSYWEGQAGMLMARDPPKVNFFSKMQEYWKVVKKNEENFVSKDPAVRGKYKVIIIPSDEATEKDRMDADEIVEKEITEDPYEGLAEKAAEESKGE